MSSNFTEALDGAINAVSTKLSDNSITSADIKILVDKLETLGDMVKEGLPFADADLADLPATLRAENDSRMDDFLVDNPLLSKYNRTSPVLLDEGYNLGVSPTMGLYCVKNPIDKPFSFNSTDDWFFLIVLGSSAYSCILLYSYFSNRSFIRRISNFNPQPWTEFTQGAL